MKSWIVGLGIAIVTLIAPAVQAQDGVANFYRGKTVTIVVGTSAGGGYDTYARLIARHMSKHAPGNPTFVVSNMPGAGSNLAAAYVYNIAPKDGTYIAALFSGAPLEPLIGSIAVQADPSQYRYLGSANNDVYVCVSRKDAAVKRFDDLFTTELVVGSTQSSPTADFPAAFNGLLRTRFKQVRGYPGSREVALAIDKNEVQGACGLAWASISVSNPEWFGPNGTMNILAQTALTTRADLDHMGVPSALSFAKTDDQRRELELFFSQEVFSRPYIMSPSVPAERVASMRKAFADTLADPELLSDARKGKLEVSPVSGEDVQQLIAKVYDAPKSVVTKVKSALQP
jgi:tripartite-type tricarboxylate transporter receptor subunit TctC